MIYILTGNGKGKTTAAIGMGIRAAGAGKKVLMIRFLKPEGGSSEDKVIKEIANFDLKSFGRSGFFLPPSDLEKSPALKKQGIRPLDKIDAKLAEQGLSLAQEKAKLGACQFLILDEICVALKFRLLDQEKVLNFLRSYRESLDLVLTGRDCPAKIIKEADLVTSLEEKKHYYQKGYQPRKGIEF
jgi:cob(I)alamin adenosyltransferase